MLKVDISGATEFFPNSIIDFAAVSKAHRELVGKTGAGSEFTGWIELPDRIIKNELSQILNAARKIRENYDALVLIGIGGSYLGARAAISMLSDGVAEKSPKIYYVGQGVSADYINSVIKELEDKSFAINMVSKSGTTLEPALSFRVFYEILRKRHGAAANKHVYATTDAEKGALKSMSAYEDFVTFVVPDDVGGRYSVLSAVGLLPIAVAGMDIDKMMKRAAAYMSELKLGGGENPAWQYAAARQQLYSKGYFIELLACYEASFRYMAEWWKQLYGESEGKDGIGIFPASLEYTADLHSMGQYVQDGPRTMFETVVSFQEPLNELKIPFQMGDYDGLNYLAGRGFSEVNDVAKKAVRKAHIEGGVPNIEISVSKRDEEGFAELVCFFEFACGLSAYISGVNPFDQPGVEAYKKNMFRLLKLM